MRRGEGCPMCEQGRPDETRFGVRIFTGRTADGYLTRAAIQRGYVVVIWRGRHVAEPTELTPEDAAAYWSEVLEVARAIKTQLHPLTTPSNPPRNAVPPSHP